MQPEGAAGASAAAVATETAGSSADKTDDAEAQPMTIGSAIGILVVGILVLAVAGFFIADIIMSDCEREGIAMTCISSGGSFRVETEYNLLLIGVGSLFALLRLARGIVGLVANAPNRTGRE